MTLEIENSHLCLYNLAEYGRINIRGDQSYHRVDFRAEDRLVGSLTGVIDGTTFVSGYSAGFGGPDFARDQERLDLIIGLLDHAIDDLRSRGIRRIEIKAKPQHYSRNEPYLHFALLRRSFVIEKANLNFFLDIEHLNSTEAYVEELKSSARKSLRHSLPTGYDWSEATSDADWEAGYRTLADNRQILHGAALSLSYEDISRMRASFPNRLALYLLRKSDEEVAASLVYRITRQHSQVMYWGDRARESHPSAMNLVAYHTVATSLAQRIKTVDLGPATTDSRINFGGVSFKANIGAVPDMRHQFCLSL